MSALLDTESKQVAQGSNRNGLQPDGWALQSSEQELASIDRVAMLKEWSSATFYDDDLIEVRFVYKEKPYPKGCHPSSIYCQARLLHSLLQKIQLWEERDYHIFFGMHPRSTSLGTKSSNAANVALARSLYVDIDDPAYDKLQERLTTLGLPTPTVIISSGHGYHLYFRLDDPIYDLEIARRYQQRLIWLIGSDAVVKDAARLLRIPATRNPGSPPKKPTPAVCKLISVNPEAFSNLKLWDRLLPTSLRAITINQEVFATETRQDPVRVKDLVTSGVIDVEERCRRYLQKMPRSIQGENGSNACFNAARVIFRDFAMTRQEGMPLLRWFNEAFCDPPWTEKELQHKADDALKPGTVPFGRLLNVNTEPSDEVHDQDDGEVSGLFGLSGTTPESQSTST